MLRIQHPSCLLGSFPDEPLNCCVASDQWLTLSGPYFWLRATGTAPAHSALYDTRSASASVWLSSRQYTAGLSHADPRDKRRLGAPSHAEDRALSGPRPYTYTSLAEYCRVGSGAWACGPPLPSQVGWGAG